MEVPSQEMVSGLTILVSHACLSHAQLKHSGALSTGDTVMHIQVVPYHTLLIYAKRVLGFAHARREMQL